jgi:trigger factor
MEHRITDVSPTEKRVELLFSPEELEHKTAHTVKHFRSMVKLPGFRPGKVPDAVVRARFGKEIQEETVHHLVQEHLEELLKEKGWHMVGDPAIEGESVEPGQEGSVQVRFHILPPVQVPDFGGIELKEEAVEVTDDEVAQTLENLRRSRGSLAPVEAPAGNDDYVLGDLHQRADGEEQETALGAKLFPLSGPDAVPELLGKRAGDEVSFVKDHPAGEGPPLAGKTVRYRIVVREVKRLVLPDLDDAFAQAAARVETLDALRAMVRKNIAAEKEVQKRQKQREEVIDQLLARVDIPIPEPLLESEKQRYLRRLAAQLYTQEMDLAKVDWQKLGKDYEPRAVRNLQSLLLLKEIARAEGLQVTDDEILAHIREECRRTGQDFSRTMKKYREDDRLEEVRLDLLMARAWDRVFEKIGGAGANR